MTFVNGAPNLALVARSQAADRAAFATSFAEVPHAVRSGDALKGVPPVAMGRRFAELQLPFESEFWVARGPNGALLGRVCANVSPFHPPGGAKTGYVGLFEADSRTTGALLLRAAETWLRTYGVKKVYGPVAFNTWFPYRLRSDAEQSGSPVFAWEPVNPPEYPSYFEAVAYSKAESYQTLGIPTLDGMLERSRRGHDKALAAGYTVRPFDRARLLEAEVPILHRLSMASFKDNFLFEPIPLELFRELYVPLADKADLSLACFIVDPQGKEQGFTFNFADGEYLVLKSFAVAPEARGQSLSNAMMHWALGEGKRRGLTKVISALVKKGQQSESYTRDESPLWSHEYTLYGKEL